MKITNSDNIMLFGFSGNAEPSIQIETENSTNTLIANLSGIAKSASFLTFQEVYFGETNTISGAQSACMIKRGDPSF